MSKEQSDNPANKWQKFSEEQEEKVVEEKSAVTPEDEVTTEVSLDDEVVSNEQVVSDFSAEAVLGAFDAERTALEREIAKYKDIAIRAEADMENLRRRAERDVSNAHKYANEKLLKELLPVLDSLNRGIAGIDEGDQQLVPMLTGMKMTHELLEKALSRFGVEVLDPAKGDAFDPTLHEAMSMQPDPEAESNTVLQVLEKGYQLNGRVLRAAMVIVAS